MTWLPRKPCPTPDVMGLEDAILWQEEFAAAVCRVFAGERLLLDGGDLGIRAPLGRPRTTDAVERVLATVFGGPECALVRGAGSGAMRLSFFAAVRPGSRLLTHSGGTYLTSRLTLEAMGVTLEAVDFNSAQDVRAAIQESQPATVLIQHMRPRVEDGYNLAELIAVVRHAGGDRIRIVVDDNYAPLKAHRLGVAVGADISAFSLFKLGGPPGIGCVLGTPDLIARIRQHCNSGGSAVQGPEALAALEGLARAPLTTAHQSSVTREVAARLDRGEVPGVLRAIAGHCPETIVLVELEHPIAKAVRGAAEAAGAATWPVGMESRHEIVPAFLQPSKSLIAAQPGIEQYVLRINPMRGGADLVVELLRSAILDARADMNIR
jgi:hypothetical protein